MAIKIRLAVAEDASALSEIGCATFTETFGHLYRSEDLHAFLDKSHSVAAYEHLLSRGECSVWIAMLDGEVVGYASAGPCDLPVPDMPENAGELQRLYLLEKAQGGGNGTALMERALAWLDVKFQHVYVSVYAENDGAQRLYARYGFEKVLDYHYMVGTHADPEWVMKRR